MVPTQKRRSKKNNQGLSPQGSGPSFLVVARVRRPFGVKGELLLETLTDYPNRLAQNERFYLGEDHHPCEVESLRRHGEDMVLRLKGINGRDLAEELRGEALYVRGDDLPPLPAGVYYLHQIEGLEVFTEQGERLGKVKEILKTGANDVYVVKGDRDEILLPAVPQVIREVRLGEGKMIVRMMEGLL